MGITEDLSGGSWYEWCYSEVGELARMLRLPILSSVDEGLTHREVVANETPCWKFGAALVTGVEASDFHSVRWALTVQRRFFFPVPIGR